MRKDVVIGLGFGDEGKGHVVNYLASKNFTSEVVRYCGGHQAGHNVVKSNISHIFSNYGSGTLQGSTTIWKAETCDPVGICNEGEVLKKKIGCTPNLLIEPLTPVTTPWDKSYNIKRNNKTKHSTIGVGFGATIQREEDNYHLYFQDLFFDDIKNEKINMIEQYYKNKGVEIKEAEKERFLQYCVMVFDYAKLYNKYVYNDNYKIYESSQGLMLDMDYGIFPYVTRAKVGTQKIDIDESTELYLVTRAYQTRHGNGYHGVEDIDVSLNKETNTHNEHQGSFITRALDLNLLNYSLIIDKGIRDTLNKNLVITCLDQMNEYKLVYDNSVLTFNSESEFVRSIITKLPPFKKIFLSHGRESHNIHEYRGV